MARNRETNRNKVKEQKKEERLESKNEWGIKDPTPQQAIDEIRAAE